MGKGSEKNVFDEVEDLFYMIRHAVQIGCLENQYYQRFKTSHFVLHFVTFTLCLTDTQKSKSITYVPGMDVLPEIGGTNILVNLKRRKIKWRNVVHEHPLLAPLSPI